MAYIDWWGDGSVVVLDLALACCGLESAMPHGAALVREVPAGARVVVVVSGTVTDVIAPEISAIVRAHPSASIVSFGACACTGGPYWDSYIVTKGVDQLVRVDHYIAGCPPPAASLADYLEQVRHG